MKKLTAGLLIAALIIVSAMPAFAFDENKSNNEPIVIYRCSVFI